MSNQGFVNPQQQPQQGFYQAGQPFQTGSTTSPTQFNLNANPNAHQQQLYNQQKSGPHQQQQQQQTSPRIQTDPFQFYQTDYQQVNQQMGTSPQGNGSMMYQVPVEVSFLQAFGTGGLPGEAPLLQELGVNIGHIWLKTFTVLNPMKSIDQGVMDDTDLWGPFLFCLAFGAFLLLSGKLHFSYIYGVAMLGWLSIYALLNLMSERGADLYRTASVLGYCLLPMVLLSGISILLKLRGAVGYGLGISSIFWCTYSSSSIFVTILGMKNQRILVAYPVGLLYACFALITIF